MEMKSTTIAIPSILTAKTFYWTPCGNASARRKNEERKQQEVAMFFKRIGMELKLSGNTVYASGNCLEIAFSYSESCNNVYKTLSVSKNCKRSNITAIKKLLCA